MNQLAMQESQDANPEWWKTIFNDPKYLQTDARSVNDPVKTNAEVDFLEHIFRDNKDAMILDLCCGQGRHALELARRGYMHVHGYDYSTGLINLANNQAHRERLPVYFNRGDARSTLFPSEIFDFVIVMGSSFGYFVDDADNIQILREAYRIIKPGDTIILDLPDKEHLLRKFTAAPVSTHTNDEAGIRVTRSRTIHCDVVYTEEITVTINGSGETAVENYHTRLYSPQQITTLLEQSGFSGVGFGTGFASQQGEDLGFMSNRMYTVAVKPF